MNFFLFDVIRDVNVKMPEEINRTGLALNICFQNGEVLDEEKFIAYLASIGNNVSYALNQEKKRYKTHKVRTIRVKHRFGMVSSIFRERRNIETRFLYGPLLCYRFKSKAMIALTKKYMTNVTAMYLSVESKEPNFDYGRLVTVTDMGSISESQLIEAETYSYTFYRLEWPYVDTCTKERRNVSIQVINGVLPGNRAIYENAGYGNLTVATKMDEVTTTYNLCSQVIYLTQASSHTADAFREPLVVVRVVKGGEPSFDIESKPRIDNIDYVTYILGAMGSWLGFTFIGINPVPYLLQTADGEATSRSAGDRNVQRELTLLRRINTQAQKQISDMKADAIHGKNSACARFNRLEEMIGNLKQEVAARGRSY